MMKKLVVLLGIFFSLNVAAQSEPEWYPKGGGEFATGQIQALDSKVLNLGDRHFLLANNVRVSTLSKRIGSLADISVLDYVLLEIVTIRDKKFIKHIYYISDKNGPNSP